MEQELGVEREEDALSIPYTRIVVRAYRLASPSMHGLTVSDVEALHPSMSVERVVRGSQVLDRDPSLRLEKEDVLGVFALREAVPHLSEWIGPELDHPDSMSFPTLTAEIALTSRTLTNKTIQQIKHDLVGAERMGCYIKTITRQGLNSRCCHRRCCAKGMSLPWWAVQPA